MVDLVPRKTDRSGTHRSHGARSTLRGESMRSILIFAALLVSSASFAKAPVHGFTAEQSQEMAEHNGRKLANDFITDLFRQWNNRWNNQTESISLTRQPFVEYDKVGYVIFSDSGEFNSLSVKLAIAKNLPEDVTLVVYTQNSDSSHHRDLYNLFVKQIDSGRLKLVYLSAGGNGFWARDAIPVPSWTIDASGQKKFTVSDARYYHSFEPDETIGSLFSADLVSHDYYYEGGNFLANARGECLVVDNIRVQKIPDQIFKDKYGCLKTIRFPHTKGIGHIDETVKLINDDLALTDDQEYASILRKNGFQVQMVPRPERKYETYVNSLYVNGTLFLPIFKEGGDQQAIDLYESFGYKVVPVNSRQLSNDGLGSVHCITMAYPPVELNVLLNNMGGKIINP